MGGRIMKTKYTATYLWPGSFVDETASRTLPAPTLAAALAEMPEDRIYGSHAFGFEITETPMKLFTAGDGEERWLAAGSTRRVGIWYFGEMMTLAEVEALNTDDRHDILLANMRGNDWSAVVRTTAGNYKPVEDGVTVLPPSQHPHLDRVPS
jgi:hypothetical protein